MTSGSGSPDETDAAADPAARAASSAPLFDSGPAIARALFHQSPFSSVIYDSAGRVLALNAAFTRLMGLRWEDVTEDYSVLTDPQLAAAGVLPLVERAFAGETVQLPPVRYDGGVYAAGGATTWTQGHFYPVRDESGAVVQVVLVHVDLTARILAEEALERSRTELAGAQRRLADILSAVTDGITVQDPGGRVVYANDAAARFVGFDSADEFVRAPPTLIVERFELLDEGGAPLSWDELPGRRAAAGEASPERLIRYRIRATGEERYSMVRARAIPSLEGEPPLVVNVFDDVTERIRYERELEETSARLAELAREQDHTLEELSARSDDSEAARIQAEWAQEQWHFLAEASRILAASLEVETTLATIARLAVPRIADWCAVHIVENDGRVRRIEVMHGDRARIEAVAELEKGRPLDAEMNAVHRVVTTGMAELYPSIRREVIAAAAPDATHIELPDPGLLSAMVVPLRAADRIVGAITLVSAESRRHYDQQDLAFAESLAGRAAVAIHTAELYQKAQEANRAKADFLAVMSHELRTPLNAILGYSDLLTEGISGPVNERQHEQLTRISQSGRHLTELIDAILTFARLEAGRDEVRITAVDIADVAREALAFIAPAAAKKGLELESRIESMTIRSDVAKIRQIMLNLLSNAVKFTNEGVVRLGIEPLASGVAVRVSDSGIGISAADQARVWEPFTQLESSLTRRSGGTGLGLPVSVNLAGLLGGTIELESAPGQGSTFTLLLPLEVPTARQ